MAMMRIDAMRKEITKHKGLIESCDKGLDRCSAGFMGAFLSQFISNNPESSNANMFEEIQPLAEARMLELESRKKHSGLMIRLFQNFIDGDGGYVPPSIMIKKFGVIVGLVKANAFDVLEGMDRATEHQCYTEGEYVVDVKRWKDEVDCWQEVWRKLSSLM